MSWTSNIPQANDNLSTSQPQIQGNFNFLASTAGNAAVGSYVLPNGLIINWGNYIITGSGNISQAYNSAYTTAVYSLVFSLAFKSSADALAYGTAVCIDNSSTPLSKTNAKFRVASSPSGADQPVLYWVAIGV